MGVNETVNIQDFRGGLLLGPREFFVNSQKELAGVERYGHKTTFLFIKPIVHSYVSKVDYITSLYHSISKELRHCDSVYLFNAGCIAAILPHTHEAGGETAAHRIKKKISQIGAINREPVPMSIGVVSVWPGHCPNVNDLIDELKSDLERDKRCQFLPSPGVKRQERRKLGVLMDENEIHTWLARVRESFEISTEPRSFSDADALVVDKSFCKRKNIKIDIKQINPALHGRIDLFYKDTEVTVYFSDALGHDFVFFGMLPLARGTRGSDGLSYERKIKDVLASIGSSTHQLNQPLQIMMGKIELLLLDLSVDGGEISRRQIREALQQIKDQVHYAAEINSKINRLTKL